MNLEKQIVSDNKWHYYINTNDPEEFINQTKKIILSQKTNKIDKVSFFIPKSLEEYCNNFMLEKEAEIKGYFNGIKPIVCYSSFIDKKKSIISRPEQNVINKIIDSSTKSNYKMGKYRTDDRYHIKLIDKKNFNLVHNFLDKLISNPEDKKRSIADFDKNMDSKTICGLFYYDQLIITGSILRTTQTNTACIKDFYFDKNFRGLNFLFLLIDQLMTSLSDSVIKTVYTFTKALDPDLNRLFGIYGFQHGGTLINEQEANGNLQNVNIWFKNLKKELAI